MPFTWQAHEIVVDPYTKYSSVAHRANYITLMHEGERYYIQLGQVYRDGVGSPVPPGDLPAWFWDQVRHLSPEARQSCNFRLPEEELAEAEALLSRMSPDVRARLTQPYEKAPRIDEKAPKIPDETPSTSEDFDGPVDDPGAPWPQSSPSRPSESPGLPYKPQTTSDPKTWTCDSCGEEVILTNKGVHLARLKRLGRCK